MSASVTLSMDRQRRDPDEWFFESIQSFMANVCQPIRTCDSHHMTSIGELGQRPDPPIESEPAKATCAMFMFIRLFPERGIHMGSFYGYEQLHMFDLQHPATALCWIGQDRLCVAGGKEDGGSELIELSIPSKLLAPDQGLVKDRDFDLLSGVKSDKTIRQVVRAKSRNIVTSEDGENLIRIWVLADDTSGSIRPVSTLHNSSSDELHACIGVQSESAAPILFGSRVCNINVVDPETCQVTSTNEPTGKPEEDVLNGIQFMGENVFVCCRSQTGKLGVGDLREGLHKMKEHEWRSHSTDGDVSWTFDVRCSGEILRCSSDGHLYISDMNDTSAAKKQVNIDSYSASCKYIEAKWCPNKKVVSVADNCGLVRLFDTDAWEKSPTKGKAIFCHEGHVVNSEEEHVGISTHIWHPTIEDLVLSAASDGSLHAWCYNKSKFAT